MPTPIDEGHVDGIKNELLKRWSATELQKITKNLLNRCKTTIVGDAEVTPDVVVLHIKEVDEVIINATKAMSGNTGVAGIKKSMTMSNDHAELKRDLTMMIRLGHEEKYQQTLAKRKLRTGTLSKNEKLLEESLPLWIWWRDLPRAKFPLAPDEHAMNDGDATTATKNIFIDAGRRRADRWRTYALEMRDTIPHEGWAWWPKGKVETIKPLITARIHDELPRYYSYDDDDEDSVRQILDAFPDSFADNILRTHLAGTLLDVPRVRQDLVSLAAQILESDSFWDDYDDSGDDGSSMGTGSRSSEVARSRINTNPDLSLSFDTNRGRSKSDMLDIPGQTTTSEKSSMKLKVTNTGQVRKARVRIPEILAAGRTAPRPE